MYFAASILLVLDKATWPLLQYFGRFKDIIIDHCTLYFLKTYYKYTNEDGKMLTYDVSYHRKHHVYIIV